MIVIEVGIGIVFAVVALCIFIFVGDVLLTWWYRLTEPRR